MVNLTFENVDNCKEAKSTEFGFNSNAGVIRDKDIIVGFFTIGIDEPEIDLQELEIVEEYKGQGYGINFIEALFLKYPDCNEITGKALEDSASFYANLKAEFTDTCSTCPVTSCYYSPLCDEDIDDYEAELCDDYSDNIFKITKKDFRLATK